MTEKTQSGQDVAARRQALLERYGAVVGGEELRHLLGYRSKTTFFRHQAAGTLQVRMQAIRGRRGLFASTEEVADWMESLRASSQ